MDTATSNASGAAEGTVSRRAAVALVLAGMAVLVSSFLIWATCPDSSCGGDGGLLALFPKSGVEFGPGVLTAVSGLLLGLIGVRAFHLGEVSPFRAAAIALALSTLVIAIGFVLRMHVFSEALFYGPREGVIFVALAGLIALAASVRLRQPARSARTPVPPN